MKYILRAQTIEGDFINIMIGSYKECIAFVTDQRNMDWVKEWKGWIIIPQVSKW